MEKSFTGFLEHFLTIWRTSDLEGMMEIISEDYAARETDGEELFDFGFAESAEGWQNGFDYIKESNAKWALTVRAVLPLRETETMAIIEAAIEKDSQISDHANLFFYTFSSGEGDWKLVRAYVEAGVERLRLGQMEVG